MAWELRQTASKIAGLENGGLEPDGAAEDRPVQEIGAEILNSQEEAS